jgi:hypothetical protein
VKTKHVKAVNPRRFIIAARDHHFPRWNVHQTRDRFEPRRPLQVLKGFHYCDNCDKLSNSRHHIHTPIIAFSRISFLRQRGNTAQTPTEQATSQPAATSLSASATLENSQILPNPPGALLRPFQSPTMFFVHEMEERIPLHPSYFSSEAPDSIRELLYKKKEGTNTGTMMIVRIIGIQEISEPKVMPGTGMAMYTISYRAVVWQPFRGEVVDGEVSQVVPNGFFVDVGALGVFVSKAVSYFLGMGIFPADRGGGNCFFRFVAENKGLTRIVMFTDDPKFNEVLDGGRHAFLRRQRWPACRSRRAHTAAHQGYPLRAEPDVRHWQHPRGLSWVRASSHRAADHGDY